MDHIEATIFFISAFALISLVYFVGPKRKKPEAKWFGVSCLLFGGYAAAAEFLDPPWSVVSASLAFLCAGIGTVVWIRTHK
jgi:RsiW-degrading membrane proteinase PrsW (M82 family)